MACIPTIAGCQPSGTMPGHSTAVSAEKKSEISGERTATTPFPKIAQNGAAIQADRRQGPIGIAPIMGVINANVPSISGGRRRTFGLSGIGGNHVVSLNLVDVPIVAAADTILGEVFEQNIVVDPSLDGTITITSSQPVSIVTALEAFELALEQNGARLLDRGDLFEIVPVNDGRGAAGLPAKRNGRLGPGYSIRVYPLDYIDAEEMASILQPIAGDGLLALDATRNLIMLAGNSSDQRAWLETIESFDVDWLSERAVGIFPIAGRSAGSLITVLERFVATDDEGAPPAYFQIVPENNAIMVVAQSEDMLHSIARTIERISMRTGNDVQLFVYDMRFARASVVAQTLAGIFDGDASAGIAGVSLDAGVASSVAAQPNAAGATLAQDSTNANVGGDQVRIIANPESNTLIIRTAPHMWPQIVDVIEQLDLPPRQVLIEATVVEVALNEVLRYGVQYFLEFGGSQAILSAVGSAIAPTLPGAALSLFSDPSVIIDALDDVTEVNVISSPNMMVLNNQAARLSVGEQVPVATQQAEDASEDSEIFTSTVEFRDTGIIFEVTPQITSSGAIEIAIRQEVSGIDPAAAQSLTPTISQRVLQSAVSVQSGETIVLGGLFSDRTTGSKSGVPGLVDIPIIGNLFGRTSDTRNRTELVVMLTPKIVNNSFDARRVTEEMRRRVTLYRDERSILDGRSKFQELRMPLARRVEQSLLADIAGIEPSGGPESNLPDGFDLVCEPEFGVPGYDDLHLACSFKPKIRPAG